MVVSTIASSGLRLVAIGVGIGLVLSIASTRVMRAFLLGVSPTDPLIFSLAAAAVLSVSVLACCVPALRAMRVDPLTALKQP